MTELKTLKDIHRFEDLKHSDHFIVSSATLRQEAIKHLKEKKYRGGRALTEQGKGYIKGWEEGINAFIKHFFNITDSDITESSEASEEDLK